MNTRLGIDFIYKSGTCNCASFSCFKSIYELGLRISAESFAYIYFSCVYIEIIYCAPALDRRTVKAFVILDLNSVRNRGTLTCRHSDRPFHDNAIYALCACNISSSRGNCIAYLNICRSIAIVMKEEGIGYFFANIYGLSLSVGTYFFRIDILHFFKANLGLLGYFAVVCLIGTEN